MALQATVDGTDLDNGTWRRIAGQIDDSTSPDGQRTVMVNFFVTGNTPADLQTNYATTRSEMISRDKRCTVTLDDGGGNDLADMQPGDGDHIAVLSTVVENAEHGKTGTSLALTLVILAEIVNTFGPADLPALVGLDSLSIIEAFNPSRASAIVVRGSFVATTGNTAEDNYNTARPSLLTTYCKCLATGGYDVTNEFVLSGEKLENISGQKNRFDFQLESEFQAYPFTNTPSARSVTLTVASTQPDEWDEAVGPVPELLDVRGGVFLDADVLSTGVLAAWATVEADVLAAVVQESSRGDLELVRKNVISDADQGLLSFEVIYRSVNALNISFTRTVEIIDQPEEAISVDSDGKHRIQQSPGSPARMQIVRVARLGVGFTDLDPWALTYPSLSGRILHPAGRRFSRQGPLRTPWSSDVWRQTGEFKFLELNLEDAGGEIGAEFIIEENA